MQKQRKLIANSKHGNIQCSIVHSEFGRYIGLLKYVNLNFLMTIRC